MSAVEVRAAIGAVFETAWANRTPVAWPNAKFDPVTGVRWARFNIAPGETFDAEIGGVQNTERQTGIVIVQLFAPLDQGDKPVLADADFAKMIFKNNRSVLVTTIGRVLFRAASVRPIGASEGWYQVNVSAPYVFDRVF